MYEEFTDDNKLNVRHLDDICETAALLYGSTNA